MKTTAIHQEVRHFLLKRRRCLKMSWAIHMARLLIRMIQKGTK